MPSRNASRFTSTAVHGGRVTDGSADVLVNTFRATRLSDPHACPLVVPAPHVGGPVLLGQGGALTVLINRKPAIAIYADAHCPPVPAPNPIVTGSSDVFYDVTDTIAGLRVWQDPDGTIHIGDHMKIPPARDRVIHANGVATPIHDGDYGAHVLGDLAKIGSTDVGKRKLQSLDASGKNVTFVPNGGTEKNAHSAPLDPAAAKDPSRGSDVNVEYTPEEWPPDPRAETTSSGAEGDVVLLHEMNHAEHQAYGREADTVRDDSKYGDYHTQEEKNSIEGDENEYRRARGFPERHEHTHN
ncbi:MAG: PAAR domain-containing protein [Polyangiales bacterium]